MILFCSLTRPKSHVYFGTTLVQSILGPCEIICYTAMLFMFQCRPLFAGVLMLRGCNGMHIYLRGNTTENKVTQKNFSQTIRGKLHVSLISTLRAGLNSLYILERRSQIWSPVWFHLPHLSRSLVINSTLFLRNIFQKSVGETYSSPHLPSSGGSETGFSPLLKPQLVSWVRKHGGKMRLIAAKGLLAMKMLVLFIAWATSLHPFPPSQYQIQSQL